MVYFTNELVRFIANSVVRGSYQQDLVDGRARWSGSDIQNSYGARYKESRKSLELRLVARGLHLQEYTVSGRVFLVVGVDSDDVNDVDSDDLLDAWI